MSQMNDDNVQESILNILNEYERRHSSLTLSINRATIIEEFMNYELRKLQLERKLALLDLLLLFRGMPQSAEEYLAENGRMVG